MRSIFAGIARFARAFARHPGLLRRAVSAAPDCSDACSFARAYGDAARGTADSASPAGNPLWEYFQNHTEGLGIWKWEHYFEIYHRHFARFVGRKVDILEIGIYGGGSLGMWRAYFGEKSHIHGVDIVEACRAYQDERTSIFIGDQGDRTFWRDFKKRVEGLDVIIDDGGHTPEQQRTTLEELLPILRAGGVYLCEDIQEDFNEFAAYAAGLAQQLNCLHNVPGDSLQSGTSRFQSAIHSIHFYPYVVVIEKNATPVERLAAPRRGTEWPPGPSRWTK